jgi:hypothetical protein
MKRIYILLVTVCIITASSCKKYLDVNTNPNAPTSVTANLYLSPILSWMATGPVYDGRQISRYTQNFTLNSSTNLTWDIQGYDPPPSDNGGMLWRTVYYDHGQNLLDMTKKAEDEQRWDLLGVAQIIKAWDWQNLTDIHGEIIIKEAFTPDPTKTSFAYDSQEFAYGEVQRLLDLAIANLQRTDGAVDAAFLGKTDIVYKGDKSKWLKFAYGLKAINLSHFSNKASYNPAAVIAAADKSFAGNVDDAAVKYTGISNDDRNFIGPTRNNFTNYRQTTFIVGLMNGTQFGGVTDPRMSRMLSPSPDGNYRGLVVGSGVTGIAEPQRPNGLSGFIGTGTVGTPTRYLFDDKSRYPIMTYAQLQFIKAEAAYKMNDKSTALAAYKNAISAHIDYVNATNSDIGGTPTQITPAEKAAYLASPAIVPATADALTLSQIMCQKYIAQYGWGFIETWTDMRRYHYTDADPVTKSQVFLGYSFPTVLYADNQNKPAYRIRPRYASEYVWNIASLEKIGALARDYHTKEMWITQP